MLQTDLSPDLETLTCVAAIRILRYSANRYPSDQIWPPFNANARSLDAAAR